MRDYSMSRKLLRKHCENTCKLYQDPTSGIYAEHKMVLDLLNQTEWIPVSERLPDPQEYGNEDYSEWVQVTFHIEEENYDVVGGAFYCFSEERWCTKESGVGEVTAWMPFPEPYKAESEK